MKDRREITIDQLSEETLLSPGAVRQHLLALEAQGLVSYIRVREGPGRPRHVFRLTTQGEDLFPQSTPSSRTRSFAPSPTKARTSSTASSPGSPSPRSSWSPSR